MKRGFRLAVLALLVLDSGSLHAQTLAPGTVAGFVTDLSTGVPLENVGVRLRNAADSTRVLGTTTGKDGGFLFAHVPGGDYVVACSLIGHIPFRSAVLRLNETTPGVSLGTVALKSSALLLPEVEISSPRSLFTHGMDRKVYNVDHDLMARSSTAGELLQKIPSVQVDIDGNVSLRGSPDVMVLIDGKKSPLMGRSRADVLQQLPAANIERIEVITNPSARFTPEGTSGIINIVMKKGGTAGVGGDATVHAGSSGRHNENLTLGSHGGNLDLYGNYSYRDDRRTRLGTDNRALAGSGVTRSLREDNRIVMLPDVDMGTMGLSYHPQPKRQVDLSVDYFRRRPTRDGLSTIVSRDKGGAVLTDYDRRQTGFELESETGVTAAFQQDFAKEDHQLRIEANASDAPQTESVHFAESWRAPAQPDPASDLLFRQTERQGHVTLDYSEPIGEKSKLEAGYALELHQQDIRSDADSLDVAQQRFIPDAAKTYHFRLDQAIQGAYGTYERTFGAFSVLGGLRVEYATVTSDLVSGGTRVRDTDTGLYPTLHLNRKLGPRREVQLSYSRRIRRPESDDLNPLPEFTDPYNMEAGNPHLKPESIHSLELSYRMRGEHASFVPSLYYRNRQNGFTRVTQAINDSTFLRTMANLASDQSAGFEPVVTLSVGRVAQVNLNANLFYDQIDASNLGYSARRSVVSWSGTCNVSLSPRATTMSELSWNYRSTRLTPQGESRPSFVLNLGVKQSLDRDRISLTLVVSDLLKTQRQDTQLDVSGIDQRVTNRRDAQVVYAGVSYQYGRTEKREREKPFQYEDQP